PIVVPPLPLVAIMPAPGGMPVPAVTIGVEPARPAVAIPLPLVPDGVPPLLPEFPSIQPLPPIMEGNGTPSPASVPQPHADANSTVASAANEPCRTNRLDRQPSTTAIPVTSFTVEPPAPNCLGRSKCVGRPPRMTAPARIN